MDYQRVRGTTELLVGVFNALVRLLNNLQPLLREETRSLRDYERTAGLPIGGLDLLAAQACGEHSS